MNLPDQDVHLSEDALEGILIGVASAADERHLAACQPCSMRLAEFRSLIGTFNEASALWSQARSNTISRELSPRESSHSTTAAWSLASVAIIAVAISLTSHLHRSPTPDMFGVNQPQQSSSRQQPDRQQEIANDNAMLVAIDSELSQPVQSPVVASGDDGTAASQAVRSEVRD